MADQKVADLTEATVTAGTDIVYVVVDPAGTPLNRKVKLSNLLQAMVSAYALTLLDDANAAASRATLGLGTMSTQDATAVAITGGSIIGVGWTSNDQTGTTYTLVLGDNGKIVRCTNAGAVTLTVPTNASVAFPVGAVIAVYAAGAGGLTVAAAGGVTIRNNAAGLVQYQECSLRKDGTDEWVRVG